MLRAEAVGYGYDCTFFGDTFYGDFACYFDYVGIADMFRLLASHFFCDEDYYSGLETIDHSGLYMRIAEDAICG